MSFCPSCGTKILENQKFCPNCGQKVEENKPIKGDTPSSLNTKKKNYKAIIVLAILVISVAVGTIINKQINERKEEIRQQEIADRFARQNAEIAKQNKEIERIASELKNNPDKYITGHNCIILVNSKQVFHIITTIDNCTFENKSNFWIKGINGSAFIENKSGNTIKTEFYADCILEPHGKKSCTTKSNQVVNGKKVVKVEITNVGYSSNGKWND